MDHNSKSGNERKECPFFQELQKTYGYIGSSVASFKESSVETEDDSSSQTDGLHTPNSSSKRMKKNRKDAVIEMLNEMREDMKEENKQLMEVLAKQHEDRMANGKNKLDRFEKFVNAFSKSNDVTK
ncbi:hypothetical protein DPMN_160885 [Dreissena polymorpha]|uniref:Uncharacterized protein n=1 Tax=Dreissena polymorpha TaxID=45954 RepID=A0A9D4IQK0_DREPO|nr:hypothetical protein DPMN_160885 [Dreissena polymorpha]